LLKTRFQDEISIETVVMDVLFFTDAEGVNRLSVSKEKYPEDHNNLNGENKGKGIEIAGHSLSNKTGLENPYQQILEMAPDAFFIGDFHGKFIYMNQSAQELTGYSLKEAQSFHIEDLFPDFVLEAEPLRYDLLIEGNIVRTERLLQARSGELVPVEMHSRMVSDGTFQSFMRDITERRRASDKIRESEESLRKKNELLRSILESPAKVIIYALDTGYRYTAFTASHRHFMKSTWGVEIEVGSDMLSTIRDPEKRKRTKQYIDRVLSGKSFIQMEERGDNPLNQSFWENRYSPIYDLNGKVTGLTVFMTDMTQQKRAERELRLREEQFRLIFEANPDSVTISRVKDGLYVDVNDAFTDVTGFTREEAIGKKSSEIHIWANPSDRDRVVTQLMETGIVSNAEAVFRTKQGRLITGLISARLIQLNKVPHILFIVRNIEQYKKAQEKLRESDERFRTIYANASIGIYRTTPDGRILMANPALVRMLGYSTFEELSKRNLESDSSFELESSRAEFREKIVRDGKVEGMESAWKKKDGSLLWIRESARAVVDANGETQYWEGTIVDLTDRKKAEAERESLQKQLLQAQKMESVGRLAGGVAHDFNNMMGVILGRAELSLAKMSIDDPLRESMEAILHAGHRSADLTRQLLAFARKQTIKPRVLDLNNTIGNMIKMLRRLIGENIDLDWKPGAFLWFVKMDTVQVDQILANLCVNARDAISGTGNLTIETENRILDDDYCALHTGCIPGRYVMIAISDDGCGMDEQTRAQIFEPFYTTKDLGRGTGLGLSTVYGIVKQNNGFINVYSEPGKGTTFRIYLSRHEGDLLESLDTTQEAAPRGSGHKILVVEDEGTLLEIVKAMLEELEYQVITETNPEDALAFLRETSDPPDLVITDVIMPGMSGKEMADEIWKKSKDLKILFMSGYTSNAIVHHGVLDSDVNFIQKPFSLRELGRKVREILNRS